MPETKLGLIPGAGGTQNFPDAVGIRRAKEFCFTANSFTAEDAYQWGLVNKLCKPETLLDDVIKTAEKISQNAPLALAAAKKAINYSSHGDFNSGFAYELKLYNKVINSNDREEGIKAFNEKRQAKFLGK